jgi:hypothetical protein
MRRCHWDRRERHRIRCSTVPAPQALAGPGKTIGNGVTMAKHPQQSKDLA